MLITVVKPGFEILYFPDNALQLIELAGRVCYKSESLITDDSAKRFVKLLRDSGHESVLEHCSATVKIICSRACTHQAVRHRLNSFSQESTRFCDYGKKGFQVICPPKIGVPPGEYEHPGLTTNLAFKQIQWLNYRALNYQEYLNLREAGIPPEDARFSLPIATKSELVITSNFRQWRHIFTERACNPKAQWEIREIMLGVLQEFKQRIPIVFDDLS